MNCYAVTFYRVSGSAEIRMIHRVIVRADSSKQAWQRFEALYPPKRFLAFHLGRLPAPTLASLLTA